MKKLLLFSSALAIVMLASCNKEQKEEPVNQGTPSNELSEPQDGSYFSFPATREVATKSYLDGQDFKWEDGEAIAVVSANGNITKFTYNETADAFTSDSFDSSTSGPFYVVSPFSESISIVDGKVITVFPADQRPGVHGVDPSALLSVGKTPDVETLSNGVVLKNAFSLVQVQISDTDVTSISFEGNYQGTEVSPSLAGPVAVDPANGTATFTGRVTSVSLAPESGKLAAGTYTLAVLPQNLPAGMKVVFKREGEVQAHYRSSSTARSLERNAGISLSSSAINVSGLKARCYYILNETDLQAWNSQTPAKSDKAFLGADIDMSGQSWSQRTGFVGSFDGQNHFIYNFVYETSEYCGFIRTTLPEGTSDIRNFGFGTKDGEKWDGVSKLTHSNSSNNYTWYYVGIIGKTQGSDSVVNVNNFATIEVAEGSTGKTRIGGICGNWASSLTMLDCINYGTVENRATATGINEKGGTTVQTSTVGGVVGQCDAASQIEACNNYGSIVNNNPYVAWVSGILGSCGKDATVKNCKNFGSVTNTVSKASDSGIDWIGVGGIVGVMTTAGAVIEGCECNGLKIKSSDHVIGGIAARFNSGTLKNCHVYISEINGTGKNYIAGIVSYMSSGGTIIGCSVEGTKIYGRQNSGGIAARLLGTQVTNCTFENSSLTSNNSNVGGIIGKAEKSIVVTGCEVIRSQVSGTQNIGGVIGWFDDGTIKDCQVLDNSTITGSGDGVGGIVGRAIANKSDGYCHFNTFDHCLVESSTITGNYTVGGIVGYAYPDNNGVVSIYNCGVKKTTSLVAKSGNTNNYALVAGICGWMRCSDSGSSYKVINCYSNGSITCELETAKPSASGIIGFCQVTNTGSGIISNVSVPFTASSFVFNGTPTSYYGSYFGFLPDSSVLSASNLYCISGLPAGTVGASVSMSDCEEFAESVFKDGTTVPEKLNAFVLSYSDYKLKSWIHNADGLPILSE